ncbi:MAG: DMT family transporter, partial [Bacteroidota bacterium]
AIIILNKTAEGLSISGLRGDLLVFLNSTSYAIYLILVRKLMKKYHPITVVKYVFFFGWLFIIPFGISDTLMIEWSALDNRAWWSVAYVLVFVSVGAYFFNAFALGELSPTVVSSYIYSQPIMASLIAISLAEDQLDVFKILGGSLIFLGVYLVSKPALGMMNDE